MGECSVPDISAVDFMALYSRSAGFYTVDLHLGLICRALFLQVVLSVLALLLLIYFEDAKKKID